jgi:hypothetical protein
MLLLQATSPDRNIIIIARILWSISWGPKTHLDS